MGIPDTFKQQLSQTGLNFHWHITGNGSMYYEAKGNVVGLVEENEICHLPVQVRTMLLISPFGNIGSMMIGKGKILPPILDQSLSERFVQEWLPSDFTDERLPLLGQSTKPYKKDDILINLGQKRVVARLCGIT